MKPYLKKTIIEISKKHILFRRLLKVSLRIKNQIMKFRYRLEKVNSNMIVFESYMGRNYSCSPKAIFEEMIQNPNYQNFTFVWVFKNPEEKKHLFSPSIKLVSYRSKEYYKVYGQAKYWITNSRLPEDLYKKNEQIYVQCWHGTPLKKLGHDIIENTKSALNSKKEINKRYDSETKKIDYFLSPSSFATEKFISAFNIKNKDVMLEYGYPRNDYLHHYQVEDVIRIKQLLQIPVDKKVVFYAPTWRDDEHTSGVGYTYQPPFHFDDLKNQLGDEYVILFRPHYLVQNQFSYERYQGFVIDISKIEDINDIYIISDVLITDYSSVFFDFGILKRPIIFYMYDLQKYETQLRGLYLNIQDLPGEIVTEEKEVLNILKSVNDYQNKYHNQYNEFSQTFHYLDDGQVTKKVINKIFSR